MNSFNPSKYSTVSSETNENSIDISNEVVEKGHKNILKVDISKFDELCRKFREKKDLKIKKLVGEDKENFDLIVNYVHLLYGTSYYSNLYDKVKKYFKNVTSIKPGTVGGYFAGCLVTKNKDAGCALGCAGSMPLPKGEEGWNSCDKAVIMAEKNTNGYNFSVVKPAETEEDLNPAYIFVESSSLADFKGFDKEEKASLKALGCKKVKLIGYSDDMNYSDLYPSAKSLEDIKHRHKKNVVKHHENNDNNDNNNGALIFAIIIFVILFLILLYLLYRYYKMKN